MTQSTQQPPLAEVSLNDKYDLSKNRIFISGSQAVVRLLAMQKEIDRHTQLEVELTPERRLARENPEVVRANLASRGFHLQFPPTVEDPMSEDWGTDG